VPPNDATPLVADHEETVQDAEEPSVSSVGQAAARKELLVTHGLPQGVEHRRTPVGGGRRGGSVEVSDAGEAAFRKGDAEMKAS
jgi:hypothetical protein